MTLAAEWCYISVAIDIGNIDIRIRIHTIIELWKQLNEFNNSNWQNEQSIRLKMYYYLVDWLKMIDTLRCRRMITQKERSIN